MSRRTAPSDVRVGFLGGIGAFFAGFGFLVRRPAVWPLAMVPVVAAVACTIGFAALGVWGARATIDALGPAASGLGAAAMWLTRVALYVVAVVTAVFAGLAVAQPLSGPALDAIVRAQGRELGTGDWPETPFFTAVGRAIRVTLVTLAVGAPILLLLSLIELLWPPAAVVTWPLKLGASALLAAWNLVDYPFALRGVGVGARWAWFRAHLGACFGFGLLLALVALVPLLGFLMLPVGVAGATRLVVSTEPKQPALTPRR